MANKKSNKKMHSEDYINKLEVFEEQLKQAIKQGNREGQLECLYNLGACYYYQSQYEEAIPYFEDCLELAKELNLTIKEGNAWSALGTAYSKLGNFEKAIVHLEQAIHFYKENDVRYANTLNMLGVAYDGVNHYEVALEYHQRALELRKGQSKLEDLAESYQNIGIIYKKQNRLKEALSYFEESLKIKREINNPVFIASTFVSIGDVYLAQKKHNKALEFLQNALELRDETASSRSYLGNLRLLAKCYLEIGEIDKTHFYLEQASKIAKEGRYKESELDNLEVYRQLYERTEDYVNAHKCAKAYIDLEETIRGEKISKQYVEMKIKYETQKLEKKLKEEAEAKEKAEMLMQELHHRVKNNLQIVSGLLRLQLEKLTDETAKEAVKSGEARLKAMSIIHRNLYGDGVNTMVVDIAQMVWQLTENLKIAYGFRNSNIDIDYDVSEDLNFDVDLAIPLCLIINELVSNTFKHAFKKFPDPFLSVSLKKSDKDVFHLKIKDNGLANLEHNNLGNSDSFGLRLIHSLSRQIKGEINLEEETPKGFSWQLRFRA